MLRLKLVIKLFLRIFIGIVFFFIIVIVPDLTHVYLNLLTFLDCSSIDTNSWSIRVLVLTSSTIKAIIFFFWETQGWLSIIWPVWQLTTSITTISVNIIEIFFSLWVFLVLKFLAFNLPIAPKTIYVTFAK